MTQKRANLLDYWAAATGPEVEEGILWYTRARAEVLEIADKACPNWRETVKVPWLIAAAAILSPRKPWDFVLMGINALLGALDRGDDLLSVTVPGFKACHRKAVKALHGDLSGLSGPKVCAFYDNLLNPVTSRAVTVDCWAYRAYLDDLHRPARWISQKQFDEVAEAYRAAAAEIGAIPCQFQAVVWVVVRRVAKNRASLHAINI
jgi:hypothetical protein